MEQIALVFLVLFYFIYHQSLLFIKFQSLGISDFMVTVKEETPGVLSKAVVQFLACWHFGS